MVMNLGFHEMRGISRLAKEMLASQKGLCCMKLVTVRMQYVIGVQTINTSETLVTKSDFFAEPI
jgi:hypothetical protein